MFSVYSAGCTVYAKSGVEVLNPDGTSCVLPLGTLFQVVGVSWRGAQLATWDGTKQVSCRRWKDRELLNWDVAAKYFQDQLNRRPESATAMSSLAIAQHSPYWNDAAAGSDSSIATNPDALSWRALEVGLGDSSHLRSLVRLTGDLELKNALASRWLEVEPGSAEAHACLAEAYADSSQYDAALAAIDQAIAREGGKAVYHAARAEILLAYDNEHRDPATALDSATEAIRLVPRCADGHFNRARVRYAIGTTEQLRLALEDLESATGLMSAEEVATGALPTALPLQRVWVLQALGQYEAAIRAGESELRKENSGIIFLEFLADLLATCQDSTFRDGQRAYELANEYRARRGETLTARELLAAACAELGDFERAIDHQRHVVGKRGEHWKKWDQERLDCYLARRPYIKKTSFE